MRCFTLLLLCLFASIVTGQLKSKQLLLAEKSETANPLQSANLGRKALLAALRDKDNYSATLAALLLGNTCRKSGQYQWAAYYDSIAMLCSRKQKDVPLQQKAANSFIRNFIDQALFSKAEVLLNLNEVLLTGHPSAETCTWYEMKALCYFNRMRFDSAIFACRTALPVSQQLHDSTSQMHLRMLIGKFYINRLQPDSVKLVHEALQYFEQKENYRYAAQAANIIGFGFETVNLPDKALLIYDKALYYYNLVSDDRNAVQTRMHMGDALLAKKEFDMAKACFVGGYQYFAGLHSEKEMGYLSLRIGKIYTDANRFDSAWYYFKIAEAVNKRIQSPVMKTGLNTCKAQLLARQEKYGEADSLMQKAIAEVLNDKVDLPIRKMQKRLLDKKTITEAELILSGRAEAWKDTAKLQQPATVQNGDYQRLERINWHTGGTGNTDSTDLDKQQRQVLQVDAAFRVPVLKDSLHTEQTGRKEAQKRSSQLMIIAGGISALLLLVATGLWVQYKNRRRAERDKAQIEALQKEVHHRVTNNLGVINAMVEMAAKASAAQMPAAALKTRIDSIALVHRLLYSGTAAIGKISLQPYFEALSTGIAAIFEGSRPVKITIDTPVETDSVLAEKLGLIVNELITNSFKYAFAHTEKASIHLYARQQKGELYLTVADNGSGLPEEAKKGYGSKLIKGLCHQLKGKYSYENKDGAFFELTVPV